MDNVRIGILRNIWWLIEEYDFKKLNNHIVPEISKGSIVVKSGYGPGEYWMNFHDQVTGDKVGFEYLWIRKTRNLDQKQRRQMWATYFEGIGDEIDSSEYMTELIRSELKFILSQRPEVFG